MTDSTRPPEDNSGFGSDQSGQSQSGGGYQPPTNQPGGYGQQQYGQPGYGGGTSQTNGFAIAALVLGILAIVTFLTIFGGLILGVLALVLGIIGLNRAKTTNGSGKGMAIAGIITGVIGGLLSLLILGGLVAIGNDAKDGKVKLFGTEFEVPTPVE